MPYRIVIALAVAWCAAFPLIGWWAELHLFADGGLFSYAVAADDAWAFHWRQISGRVAAFLWASWPASLWGRLSGDPAGAVTLYALLHFSAPALGFAAVWRADRTGVIRLWAALSLVLLCPVTFGFPTELWTAHAAVWPMLALFWTPGSRARWAAGTLALGIAVLSHEGGIVWAFVLCGALALSPDRARALSRAALSFGLMLAVWIACRVTFPPDPAEAEVLRLNAWNLLRVSRLWSPLMLTLAAGLGVYGAALALRRGPVVAFAAAASGLTLWWTLLDSTLHAGNRYDFRTLLLGAVPVLMLLAAARAAGLARKVPLSSAAAGAVLLVTLIHGVETAKFVRVWRDYTATIRALAAGDHADPLLGDDRFVSAARVPARIAAVSWPATVPFLSVMVSEGYAPRRLAAHPDNGYFWFDCAAAAANAAAPRALPGRTREMVRIYTCGHR